MGLGGDDRLSPCVHNHYLIPPASYSFSVRLCTVTPATSGYDIYKSKLQNSRILGSHYSILSKNKHVE